MEGRKKQHGPTMRVITRRSAEAGSYRRTLTGAQVWTDGGPFDLLSVEIWDGGVLLNLSSALKAREFLSLADAVSNGSTCINDGKPVSMQGRVIPVATTYRTVVFVATTSGGAPGSARLNFGELGEMHAHWTDETTLDTDA